MKRQQKLLLVEMNFWRRSSRMLFVSNQDIINKAGVQQTIVERAKNQQLKWYIRSCTENGRRKLTSQSYKE